MESREKRGCHIPTCREMAERVTDYLERVIPMRERVGMGIHLVACTACRNYFNQIRQTVRLLASRRRDDPQPETEQRVLTEIARIKSEARTSPPSPAPSGN